MSAPLRFIAVIILGWAGVRAWMLMPEAVIPAGEAAEAPTAVPTAPPRVETERAITTPLEQPLLMPKATRAAVRPSPPPIAVAAIVQHAQAPLGPVTPIAQAPPIQIWPQPRPAAAAPLIGLRGVDRWSASAWLLVRGDQRATLASAGTLGGSQAGFRLGYRLTRPLALSARISSPLRNRDAAEAALGLEWRPLEAMPVALLAERRQAIGRDGRSGFALLLHGGSSWRLPERARLDLYAQAGVVGTRSRDLFADGAAHLGVPIRGIEIGAALSAGAQPGLARLDVGPQVTLRVPFGQERLRVTAEWRFRIAGDARPGSGPALTLASDF